MLMYNDIATQGGDGNKLVIYPIAIIKAGGVLPEEIGITGTLLCDTRAPCYQQVMLVVSDPSVIQIAIDWMLATPDVDVEEQGIFTHYRIKVG
jgi:hypothetical protein